MSLFYFQAKSDAETFPFGHVLKNFGPKNFLYLLPNFGLLEEFYTSKKNLYLWLFLSLTHYTIVSFDLYGNSKKNIKR